MTVMILNAPIYTFSSFQKYGLDDKPSIDLTGMPLFIKDPELLNSPFSEINGHVEVESDNTLYQNIMDNNFNNKSLVYEDGKFYIYNFDNKTKLLMGMFDPPFEVKFDFLNEFREEFNNASIVRCIISKEPLPKFPNVKYWIHLLINMEKKPFYLKVLDKTSDVGHRDVAIFFVKNKTMVFSILSGIFIYGSLVEPEDDTLVTKFKDKLGKTMSAIIKAENQTRDSVNRDRALKGYNEFNRLYRKFDKDTNWFNILARNIYLLFFTSKNKFIKVKDFRIDSEIARLSFDYRSGGMILSFKESERFMAARASKVVTEYTHKFYDKYKSKIKKFGYKLAVNIDTDCLKDISNNAVRELLNDTYFVSVGSVVSAIERF